MHKLLKGNITKKILMVLVVAILFNFVCPLYSHAEVDGGVLFDPIKMFLAAIGDIVMSAVNNFFTGVWIGASDAKAVPDAGWNEGNWAQNIGSEIDWPTILISPQEIFSGKVLALNVNFLRAPETGTTVLESSIPSDGNANNDAFRTALLDPEEEGTIGTASYQSSLNILREQISKWYILIRNLSATALFCVLIYIGIRMVLSSISEERAKYKKMMLNWLVAICLVFFLHYIMAVIMFVTEKAVAIIGDGLDGSAYTVTISGNVDTFHLKYGAKIGGGTTENIEGDGSFTAKVYNLTELARVYVSAQNRGIAFSYLLVYLVLVVYTIIFIFKYLKRFIYMAFLTMIAPIIAFTYPIDKMGDGKSQAFNAWLTEYLFNALLQPLHLIIYMVLVGSAIELTQTNPIYAIVALGFITQAEKLLRKFFGLDHAATADSPGGAFAKGALASQALSRIKSGGKSVASKALGGGSGASGGKGSKPRTANLSAYLGGNGDSNAASVSSVGNSFNAPRTTNQLNQADESTSNINTTPSVDTNIENISKLQNIPQAFKDSNKDTTPNKATNVEDTNKIENIPQTLKNLDNDKNTSKKLNMKNTNLDTTNKKKKKIKGPYIRTKRGALKGMAVRAGKGIGTAAWQATKYTGKKLGKGAIRTLASAPGTMVGAMLGGAMSIATGDTSYLAAGVAAGVVAGKKPADAIMKAPKAIRTAYREERLGDQKAKDKARFDEFKKNKDNINYFKDKYSLSTKEAKEKIEQGRDFIEAGYTDVEDVDRLMKMQNVSKDSSSEQIMAADQMASKLKFEDFIDDKKSASLENNLARQMQYQAQAQGKKISNEQAKNLAQKHMNSMRVSKGIAPKENIKYIDTKKPEPSKNPNPARKTSEALKKRKKSNGKNL